MHSNTSVSLIDPINWRAGCVNSACPVRREGELTLSLPLSVAAAYLTAPKVKPRTKCFWVSHPSTMIGATAKKEAAESFAQKRPSGLE
jgi:hypothetical protein